ncbi:MAG: aromatic ring-hydroxylating dioxygenase subunit alpha [Candidatus Binataceae bacterium]|nr:aromatic ring-hydroxylating dioxygenase subunit alpha [Candidatus Binataceae bacterium]
MASTGRNIAEGSNGIPKWTANFPHLGFEPRPVEKYVSTEEFEKERGVFRHSWLHVGRVEEISKPGDYLVKDIAICKTSILVVRGKDGELRAFHNVCRHRGNKLVWDSCGSQLRYPCKFHGWTYNTDGQLVGVPEEDMFFDFDRSSHGLVPVAVDNWEGFIFINLSPREPLNEFLGEIPDLLNGYDFARLSTYYGYSVEMEANWKILRDSQIDAYHAKYLHRRSVPGVMLNRGNPSVELLDVQLGQRHGMMSVFANPDPPLTPVQRAMARFGPSVAHRQTLERLPKGLNPQRSNTWLFDMYYLFPNFHLLTGASMCIIFTMWPLAPSRGLLEGRLALPKAHSLADWFARDYARCLQRDIWLEDGSTLENTQKGLSSGVVGTQLLQDQEIMIRHAEKVLDDAIAQQIHT